MTDPTAGSEGLWGDAFVCEVEGRAAFLEIDPDQLALDKWDTLYSGRWTVWENILRTEARGVKWATRHKFRKAGGHERMHLFLCDNLPLVLALTKGQADSHCLRGMCIRASAYAFGCYIATGCTFAFRWVPSELKPADGPSRGLLAPENQALQEAPGLECTPAKIDLDSLQFFKQLSGPELASKVGLAEAGHGAETEKLQVR